MEENTGQYGGSYAPVAQTITPTTNAQPNFWQAHWGIFIAIVFVAVLTAAHVLFIKKNRFSLALHYLYASVTVILLLVLVGLQIFTLRRMDSVPTRAVNGISGLSDEISILESKVESLPDYEQTNKIKDDLEYIIQLLDN